MFLGGAVWLHTVWIETRSLRVNSGDGGRGKGAGSLLGRDGAKKIHPGSPGLMLVGREMLQRGGGGKIGIWGWAFFVLTVGVQ